MTFGKRSDHARRRPSPNHRAVAVLLGCWLLAAIAFGASGVIAGLKPPAPQLMLLAITALTLIVGWTNATLRAWAKTVDLRLVVAFHFVRFVGAYFLILERRGELPAAFALPAGWGDLLVAVLAVFLVFGGSPSSVGRTRLFRLWNLLGAVDILLVVATAARLAIADPASMSALAHLPLNLLLTFVVPLIIATHVLIAARLRANMRVAAT